VDSGRREVVLDTNVFVAAGFNPDSHSAWLVEAVRDGRLRMVWDDSTRAEIESVMRQIKRLSWTRIADLFRSEDRFGGATHPEAFGFVPDPADCKFAALADAVQAPLVTSDAGLLNACGQMAVRVLKPSEFVRRFGVPDRKPGLG
jgi:predicted nucleic acid-binding protein